MLRQSDDTWNRAFAQAAALLDNVVLPEAAVISCPMPSRDAKLADLAEAMSNVRIGTHSFPLSQASREGGIGERPVQTAASQLSSENVGRRVEKEEDWADLPSLAPLARPPPMKDHLLAMRYLSVCVAASSTAHVAPLDAVVFPQDDPFLSWPDEDQKKPFASPSIPSAMHQDSKWQHLLVSTAAAGCGGMDDPSPKRHRRMVMSAETGKAADETKRLALKTARQNLREFASLYGVSVVERPAEWWPHIALSIVTPVNVDRVLPSMEVSVPISTSDRMTVFGQHDSQRTMAKNYFSANKMAKDVEDDVSQWCLFEYVEEKPLFVPPVGLPFRIVSYGSARIAGSVTPPVSVTDRACPFGIGSASVGVSNGLFDAPILAQPTVRRRAAPDLDFLLVPMVAKGQQNPVSWTLRAMPASVFVVGQQIPRIGIPTPAHRHSRRLLTQSAIAYLHVDGSVPLEAQFGAAPNKHLSATKLEKCLKTAAEAVHRGANAAEGLLSCSVESLCAFQRQQAALVELEELGLQDYVLTRDSDERLAQLYELVRRDHLCGSLKLCLRHIIGLLETVPWRQTEACSAFLRSAYARRSSGRIKLKPLSGILATRFGQMAAEYGTWPFVKAGGKLAKMSKETKMATSSAKRSPSVPSAGVCADYRKLKKDRLKELLRRLGVEWPENISRWKGASLLQERITECKQNRHLPAFRQYATIVEEEAFVSLDRGAKDKKKKPRDAGGSSAASGTMLMKHLTERNNASSAVGRHMQPVHDLFLQQCKLVSSRLSAATASATPHVPGRKSQDEEDAEEFRKWDEEKKMKKLALSTATAATSGLSPVTVRCIKRVDTHVALDGTSTEVISFILDTHIVETFDLGTRHLAPGVECKNVLRAKDIVVLSVAPSAAVVKPVVITAAKVPAAAAAALAPIFRKRVAAAKSHQPHKRLKQIQHPRPMAKDAKKKAKNKSEEGKEVKVVKVVKAPKKRAKTTTEATGGRPRRQAALATDGKMRESDDEEESPIAHKQVERLKRIR